MFTARITMYHSDDATPPEAQGYYAIVSTEAKTAMDKNVSEYLSPEEISALEGLLQKVQDGALL